MADVNEKEEVERVNVERKMERLQIVRELEHLADHMNRYLGDG